jgi:hypothetical protein
MLSEIGSDLTVTSSIHLAVAALSMLKALPTEASDDIDPVVWAVPSSSLPPSVFNLMIERVRVRVGIRIRI